jgi:fermentation-respiration switch protein FrsA (DUF1100 family)
VVAGLSIGCGPAVDLASRNRVAGLIMVVPLSNVREVGVDIAPWYLRWAVPMLARHAAFDNRAKISRVDCPILMVRATRDQVTSPNRSEELVAAAKKRIQSVVVDADHDGSWRAGRSEIDRWLRALFESAPSLVEEKKPNRSPESADVRVAPGTTLAHL